MIKLGVIGTGSQGLRFLHTISRLDCAKVEMVSNRHGSFQNYICKEDWQDVLASGIDGLIVAADPAIHLKVLQAANFRGIPVLLEKPAGLSYMDVQKMDKLKIPILVDYTHLFAPDYMKLKEQAQQIEKITSLGYARGPFREYSALYDYAPHDLAMCLDLCGGDFELISQKVAHGATGGNLYTIQVKTNGIPCLIKTGNGGIEKKRNLLVTAKDGYLLYDGGSNADYQKPLENVVKHFMEIIDGKPNRVPFEMTMKIHKLLYKLGVNYAG